MIIANYSRSVYGAVSNEFNMPQGGGTADENQLVIPNGVFGVRNLNDQAK
jgi:hypothetical protein